MRACEDHGWPADLDSYQQCIGSTYEKTREILVAAYGADFPYETVDASWAHHYHSRLADGPVPVKAGAEGLLAHLSSRQVPMALVTSTRRETAVTKLGATGLLEFFDVLVCGGETEKGKPDPDPYLAAAARLDLEPRACWALEDSANGVRRLWAPAVWFFRCRIWCRPRRSSRGWATGSWPAWTRSWPFSRHSELSRLFRQAAGVRQL